MPWIRTRDILKLSSDFYKEMRRFYEALLEENRNQRFDMLLGVVQNHVEYLEKNIRTIQQETPREVLDAWFQFSPDPPELDTDPTQRISADMTIDDVTSIILDFDAALSEFYNRVADSTGVEDVKELFLQLKNNVEAEKEKLSFNISGMNSM